VSEREKIGTISLSGTQEFRPIPVKGIKAVIGVEYDLKNNCLYYGDADQDFIGVGFTQKLLRSVKIM
jgi:hypothetical protein